MRRYNSARFLLTGMGSVRLRATWEKIVMGDG